jgi:digeranylgeranylglycerophospholipid reductase
MKNSDVLVIGGGPSGLRLAAGLAGSGFRVRVLERKPEIGSNVICTGIVGREVFDEFGLNTSSILREMQAARLVSPSGNEIVYRHPRPFAFVVDRELFDRNLAAQAEAAGAEIETGTRAEEIRIGRDGVCVGARKDGGDEAAYSAGVAVISTGNDFSLHRTLGLGRPKEFLNGAQVEVAAGGDPMTTLFVGRDVAPGAFAWAVPSGPDRVRIGLLSRGDSKTFLLKLVSDMRPNGVHDIDPEGVRVKAIAQGLLSRTFGDRVLALGEAAGQVKTTTGGGISYGLKCADIAVGIIRDAFARGDLSAGPLLRYESAWKNALQKEIVLGHMTRKMCAKLTDSQMESIFRLAQTDGIIPIIRNKGDFDWHSDLILALARRLSFMGIFKELAGESRPDASI